jgi:hypothetical protein
MPRGLFAIAVFALTTGLMPGSALELGPVVGTHSLFFYPIYWMTDEELMTQNADIVGVLAERQYGSVAAGLRLGLVGSYEQAVWMWKRPVNEYRGRAVGGDLRASVVYRPPMLSERLYAQAGVALGLDYFGLWSWSNLAFTNLAFGQAVTAGLRWRPNNRVSLGMDVDLNLAREGSATDHYDTTTYSVCRIGTISPSVVLYVLFPVGSR